MKDDNLIVWHDDSGMVSPEEDAKYPLTAEQERRLGECLKKVFESFFEENAKIKYCILDALDKDEISHMENVEKITILDADAAKDKSWSFIYDYVKKNLP